MGNYSTFAVFMPCDWDCSYCCLCFDNSKVPVTGLFEINALILIFLSGSMRNTGIQLHPVRLEADPNLVGKRLGR